MMLGLAPVICSAPFQLRGGIDRLVAQLFAGGEQGCWYDPSDMSTLFQDAAGTVPVTAVEQPVGLVLDKRGLPQKIVLSQESWQAPAIGGPAASLQVVGPVLEVGEYYALSVDITGYSGAGTVGFTSDVFSLLGATISGNGRISAILPTISAAAVKLFSRNTNTATFSNISITKLPGNHLHQPTATARPVLSARVNLLDDTEYRTTNAVGPTTRVGEFGGYAGGCKFNGGGDSYWYRPAPLGITAVFSCVVLMEDGLPPVLGVLSAQDFCPVVNGGQAFSGAVLTNLGEGYYKITCAAALITGANTGVVKYSSNSARKFTATAYSLVQVNNGNLPYQRVNTASDYDTVGFPHYLKFDGIDDNLSTVGNMDLSGTDKVTVVAGVRKLSDVAAAMLVELGPNFSTTVGGFYITAPETAGAASDYRFQSRGTFSGSPLGSSPYLSPTTNVVTAQGDIAAPYRKISVNGVLKNTSTATLGTGNHANDILNVGSRTGTALFFNGHLYSLIVRGAESSLSQIEATEAYIKQKMRLP